MLGRRALKILVIADSKLVIPPPGYGGVERIVACLADGLSRWGHNVVLMGHPGSRIAGRVVGYPFAGKRALPVRAAVRIAFAKRLARELQLKPDIVLATCRIDYLSQVVESEVPLVYSFHNPISSAEIDTIKRMRARRLSLVALTHSHASQFEDGANIHVIGNCVELSHLSPSFGSCGGYLAFLGRLTSNKGVDTAIRVARITGLPLRLAGNISDEDGGRDFFDREVRPQLDDQVTWVGEILEHEKSRFLGGARALLMPVRWEEPFGLVVAEALACGTPVIASPRGSMRELIRPGENGFLASTDQEFSEAIARIPMLDRRECRADAEARFSSSVMIEKYIKLIFETIEN